MTLTELRKQVAALGFRDDVEDPEAFVVMANRALLTIFNDWGVTSTARIAVTAPRVVNYHSSLLYKPEAPLKVKLYGKSFSFEAYGSGSVTVYSKNEEKKIEFENGEQVADFINDEAELCFGGNFSYTILVLTSFDCLSSDKKQDIPIYSMYRIIDKNLLPYDFMSLHSAPTDARGIEIPDVHANGGAVLIPFGYTGEIYFTYKRRPKKISLEDEGLAIDIPPQAESMLGTLTAAYLYLDEEPEKAEYYMALYKQEMSDLRRFVTRNIGINYRTNRWA